MSINNATNNLFLNQKVTQTAANYTASPTDVIIEVTNTSAARTITLPNPSTNNAGKFYVIKDISGGAATNNISIVPPPSFLIDGSANLVIATNYGAIQVYSDGTNYYSQAFVLPNPTGNPLARASWSRFAGGGFLPGVTVGQIINFAAVGPSASRIDVTGLTQIIPPVNLTVAAQQITIIRPGLYCINLSTCMGPGVGSNTIAQVVKNGTLVAAQVANQPGASAAATVEFTYMDNFAVGDVLDVRGGANPNAISFYSITYSIAQVPTTF